MTASIASRNPWPIAITAYFALFITFIISFITFAARQPSELIGGDYYDQEIRYQQQIDRLNRTAAIHADLGVTYDPKGQCFKLKMPASQARSELTTKAWLYRPSDARLDRELKVDRSDDGAVRLDAKDLSAGFWKLRFAWSAGTNEYFVEEPVVIDATAH